MEKEPLSPTAWGFLLMLLGVAICILICYGVLQLFEWTVD